MCLLALCPIASSGLWWDVHVCQYAFMLRLLMRVRLSLRHFVLITFCPDAHRILS